MTIVNHQNEVLHRIRVKLYPNYLPRVEGAYIARTVNEAGLSIEQICAALKNRGGFTGNYDDLVKYVGQFFDEAAYQLCDGFSINTGYFSVHPNVGGTFDSVNGAHDREQHPVTFRFRPLAALRALARHIEVHIEGVADLQGYIGEFLDIATEAVNETATPGGQFILGGHKVRVFGEDPACGVYFAPEADPAAGVKAAGRLAENAPSKLIGIIPSLSAGAYKVVVKTQYTGSANVALKTPRVIVSSFTLTVV
jgi:hypothetical protein